MSGNNEEFVAEMYAAGVLYEWDMEYKPLQEKPIEHRTFLIHLIYSTLELQTNQLHEVFIYVLHFLDSNQGRINEFALLNSMKILESKQADLEKDTRTPSSDRNLSFSKKLKFEDEDKGILTSDTISTMIDRLNSFAELQSADKKPRLHN